MTKFILDRILYPIFVVSIIICHLALAAHFIAFLFAL